jgi:hypothetical protein
MQCNRVVDAFVSRVNSLPREPLDLDEVPVSLRVSHGAHQADKDPTSTDWKIVPADHSARIEALEQRVGRPFPPSFRSLICRYSFPAFECGPLLLFSNTGEPLPWELQDRLFADRVMSPQLLAAGYLQIGNPQFYDYDPVCIEAAHAGAEGKVVQLCHESILCDDTLVIRKEISSSFLQLMSVLALRKAEPSDGAESR